MIKFIQLQAWYETGLEGIEWIGYDFSLQNCKSNYDKIIMLKNGDKLTIFEHEDKQKILWEGVIKKELSCGNAHWMQPSVDQANWQRYFSQEKFAQLERAD
jgi:hypothetical protein